MRVNPCVWFEIYVDDMERARAFYEAVFETGLEKLENPSFEMWMFPLRSAQSYGAHGALVKMDGVRAGGNSTIVYFSCDDCMIESARAVQQGGTLFREKFPIGENGFIALIIDTEGNLVGLHSRQ